MQGIGLILNQGISLSTYKVSKKVIHLLRHSLVQRGEDGAVHFWRIREKHQSQFPQIPHWCDNRWKACMAAGGGVKRRYQYCTDDSGIIVYLRALQRHSGRNLIDLSLQDNVVIQSGFFQQEVRIQTRDRQYSFCLLILETKNTRILKRLTWEHHVVRNSCIIHATNIKTRYIGSTSIFRFGKD